MVCRLHHRLIPRTPSVDVCFVQVLRIHDSLKILPTYGSHLLDVQVAVAVLINDAKEQVYPFVQLWCADRRHSVQEMRKLQF